MEQKIKHLLTVSKKGVTRVTLTGPEEMIDDDCLVNTELVELGISSYKYIKGSTYRNSVDNTKVMSRSYEYIEPNTIPMCEAIAKLYSN